ncbi:SH3 domain-containing protein [Virgibacillus sp. MSP4-1]|uniref:SH3 domain-containing protein n=1 Tax=Virgibacillus sp. MSP4-1 TaxID=2700081 RepID=UPI0003A6E269|nr:SH3 domain-containing protein [Virgibacillus sp. MSP4-1]QHS23283.1 SH3 domain-containing protein [Virgibacillus sp. MSP4-1]
MAQEKLESYFKDSQLEYEHIHKDLQTTFNPQVYEEIIALVEQKTTEGMDNVWGQLNSRYEALSRLENSMPEEPTQEDQDQYIKEFFSLTDPGKVSEDLKQALQFNELEYHYQDFISKLSTEEYGEIFNRYLYPPQFFHGLRKGILHHIDQLTQSLKAYTDTIGEHALLMDSIRQDQKGKSFIKGGASLLGLLVGVPFAGAGVGALMGGNDQSKINDSLSKVFHNWNTYIDQFNDFLKELENHFRLAMITLYGGTLLRVEEQFQAYHMTIAEIALLSGNYALTLTPQEREETERWIKTQTNGIYHLLKYKQWQEAIRVSKELFHIVQKNPVTARTMLYDEKSGMYIAHLYYYLSYQQALLEEYKNGHLDSFYETSKKLFNDLQLILSDKDIPEDFSSMAHLFFRFIKESLRRGQTDDLHIIFEYIKRLTERMKRQEIYFGEHIRSSDDTEGFNVYEILERYFIDVMDLKIDTYSDEEDSFDLKPRQIKTFIQIDNEIGRKDKFTRYLKRLYWKSLFIRPFSWFNQQKKRIGATVLAGALLFGSFTYGDEVYQFGKEQVEKIGWFDSQPEQPTEEKSDSANETIMTITTEYANIRSAPSLNSEIVYTANQSDKLIYLNEEKTDDEGITWYHVEMTNNTNGWISSRIVE